MDLPPIPKSDRAEAFLKDAPQENSELLYCQYLLGATKMKLILKGVGNSYRETETTFLCLQVGSKMNTEERLLWTAKANRGTVLREISF